MPKLAIYVPKKEMKEIDRWRKQINFSKVFMRALAQEIRDRSRTVDADEEKLASAAAFYKARLSENSGDLVDFGYQIGSQQVLDCELVPETIRGLIELRGSGEIDASARRQIEDALGRRKKEIDTMANKQGLDEATHPTWRMSVHAGYLHGVAAAWEQICRQMNYQ